MKIQTLSIVVGDGRCNATCPFCISKMTGREEGAVETDFFCYRHLDKALQLAHLGGCTTALITGKGEPTLRLRNITALLECLKGRIPLIELQTNGLVLSQVRHAADYGYGIDMLNQWVHDGLTTVAISLAHYNPAINEGVFGFSFDVHDLIDFLQRDVGVLVRLTCTMFNGGISSTWGVEKFLEEFKDADQVSFCRVGKPDESADPTVDSWVRSHEVTDSMYAGVESWLGDHGSLLTSLMHKAKVFDYKGQSVCLRDCLTADPDEDGLRQLILYPSGRLTYDWQHRGAVLLPAVNL